jgi:membrane protease subunit (stomatin/prohibitin family)
MGIFNKPKKGGMADVIRCDETNYLVWNWHPNKHEQGSLKRETAIRTNSVLRVKTGEVAVFVYKQKNGTMQDYIVGPHDEKLKTKNFPVLSSIIGLWYEGDTPFQAEVFFINIAWNLQIRFGIPYFDVVDPRFPDFPVPVAVRGALTFKIEDYKTFVKYHQLVNFAIEELKNKINASVHVMSKRLLQMHHLNIIFQ